MIYNILDYGAVPDGVTINSAAVTKAIDACAEAGGGTVLFPEGVFVLSTVFLKSNVKIEISRGCTILGAPSFYDYEQQEEIDYIAYQDASHTYFHLSMFVGINCDNIAITGGGKIDMRSVWDEDDVRKILGRGPKCIALKYCNNVEISNLEINNVTDLAVYFAGCENVEIFGLKMRVYIDGISPDNSKNVNIYDCDIEAGDDGIVLKSSYTLNKLGKCENIHVWNCYVKSRCSALKFGTESNGGFENIVFEDCVIYDTRISGISVESVDGAHINNILFRNIKMTNCGGPFFVHIGRRMRGPKGREIGTIKNVTLENITVTGPYVAYPIIALNHMSYVAKDEYQYPWAFWGKWGPHKEEYEELRRNPDVCWQFTSNLTGLPERPLENITLKNVHLSLSGGCQSFDPVVSEEPASYPEIYCYGNILPAKGIYARHIRGLVLDNVTVSTERPDIREEIILDDVT